MTAHRSFQRRRRKTNLCNRSLAPDILASPAVFSSLLWRSPVGWKTGLVSSVRSSCVSLESYLERCIYCWKQLNTTEMNSIEFYATAETIVTCWSVLSYVARCPCLVFAQAMCNAHCAWCLNTKETHCINSCTLVSDPWCSFLPPKVGREKSLEQCEQSETSCNTFGFDLIFISGYILSCFYYRICIEFFLSADICRITTQVNSSTFGGSNHSNSRCLQLNNS